MKTSFNRIKLESAGFTLIELLVVMSIIAIVSTISVASFVSYSQNATLKQASSDVANLLRDAKAQTQAQVKPASCSGTLNGYRVDICGLIGSACSTQNTYTLSRICSGTKTVLSTKQLPKSTSFQQSGTTETSFTFQTVTNGVSASGDIIISMPVGSSTTLTSIVTVGQSGSVTIH